MSDLKNDPFVRGLLEKLPADSRESFSDEQLLALKVALGARSWGKHALDWRWTLKVWRWHYYVVFLAGRNRRDLSRKEQELARLMFAMTLATVLMFSTLMGLLILYLVKSALGIDLLPGFSFGVWDWFKETWLN